MNAMQASASRRANQLRFKAERGFSLIELLIVVAIILIIAAIAIPSLLRSRMDANQASGVANLRTISTAAVSYWVTYSNGYPATLGTLGGNGPVATCNQAILIDEVIAAAPSQKSGYQFTYTGDQGNVTTVPPGCTPGFNGYLATAAPIVVGLTGNISYCNNEPGVIHYDTTGAVAASSATCDLLPVIQ
jgi:prepilin-type N-terminal cleavage/methylation domain-containing protein